MGRKRIEYRDPATLTPYANNPRDNEASVPRVKASIQEFHFQNPILVDPDGVVIAGHTRLKAALELGLAEVPVVVVDDLTPEQVRAYRLADNKAGEASEWLDAMLAEELAAIEGIDMSEFGFDVPEVEDADLDGFGMGMGDGSEDDVPDVDEVEPTVKRGQVWRLGDHVLMCGDSTSEADMDALMDGDRVVMVLTDPPYGMRLDTDFTGMESTMGDTRGHEYRQVIGDHEDFDPALITSVLKRFDKVPEIFLWGGDYYAEIIPDRNKGAFLVWDKTGGTDVNLEYDKMYGSNFELCWSKARHKRAIIRRLWKGFFGLSSEDTRTRVHPTQKPVDVMRWLIERFGQGDGVVVDPYGGSGSTLIACEQTGHRCRMMELDPRYCDVIIARWESMTGRKAELVGESP